MTGGDDGLWAGRADEWLVSGWPQVACLVSWIGYALVRKSSRYVPDISERIVERASAVVLEGG